MNKTEHTSAALSAAPEPGRAETLLRRLRPPRRLRASDVPDEREEREGQRRAAGRIAAFFVLMLALTLFARGMAGAAATEVEVTYPVRGQVTECITLSGTLESQTTEQLTLPEGLTVRSVYVSAGQAVQAGQALLAVDPDSLSDALIRAQGELDKLNLQLAQYRETVEADDSALSSAETSLERVQEDNDAARASQALALSRAQEALEDAKDSRSRANAALAAAKASRDAMAQTLAAQYDEREDLEAQLAAAEVPDTPAPGGEETGEDAPDGDVPDGDGSGAPDGEDDDAAALRSRLDALNAEIAENETALAELEGEVQSAQDAVESAQDAVDAATDSVEDARTAAQESDRSARRSVEDAETALAQAREDYADAQTEAERQNLQNQTEAELLAVTIAGQEAAVARLTALQAAEGVLSAPADGTVRTMDGLEGGAVSLTFTVRGDGYRLTLTGDALSGLSVGSVLTVRQGKEQSGETTLATLDRTETGEWTATARLTGDGWTDGDAEAEVVLSSGRYDLTLPASACHTDNGGSFVYVAELRESVLGLGYVVRREPVNVLASDGSTAAVDGILTGESMVISGATRSVQEGERVRVAQP